MKNINELLKKESFNQNIAKFIPLAQNWKKMMGDFIGNNAYPVKLTDGLLVVGVSDNMWLTEMSFMKSEFLSRLYDFGYLEVKDIKFIIHKIKILKKHELPKREIDKETLKNVDTISSIIKNEELRTIFKKTLIDYFTYGK
jgi:hypothetical protein